MIITIICLLFIFTYIFLIISQKVEFKVNLDNISLKLFGLTLLKVKTIKLVNKITKIKKKPMTLKESVSYIELIKEIKVDRFDVLYGNNKVTIEDYLLYGLISIYNSIVPKYINYIAPIHFIRSLNQSQIEIKVQMRFKIIDVLYRLYYIRRLDYGKRSTV